jgi:putative ABC transport system permease protein
VLKSEWLLIVGVVADEKHFSHVQEMSWDSSPLIYRPLSEDPPTQVNVMVRGAGEAGRIGETVRSQIASIDPNVPVFDIETLDHFLTRFTAYPEFRAVLLGGFAGLALLLSAVGLYGVLSQLVEQRTQEIGVRVALGAQQSQVLKLVLRSGMVLTGLGICLGLLASGGLTRFLASLLYGVGSTDLWTFGSVCLVLLAAAFAAMYIPARRATKVEPLKALRYE